MTWDLLEVDFAGELENPPVAIRRPGHDTYDSAEQRRSVDVVGPGGGIGALELWNVERVVGLQAQNVAIPVSCHPSVNREK